MDEANAYKRTDGGWRCRACQALRHRKPSYREAHRIRQEGYRRRKGIKPRNLSRKVPSSSREVKRLRVEPFREWLKEMSTRYTMGEMEARLKVDERRLYAVMHESGSVNLDIVDRALTEDGFTGLWELYPELYPDE
jgi:hypothetical protein